MSYEVQIVPGAAEDVQEILAWIRQRSPEGAAAWRRAWSAALERLEQFPETCNPAPESHHHAVDLKQLIFKTRHGKPYRIVLTIRQQVVVVLHVRGPGQNLLKADEVRVPQP